MTRSLLRSLGGHALYLCLRGRLRGVTLLAHTLGMGRGEPSRAPYAPGEPAAAGSSYAAPQSAYAHDTGPPLPRRLPPTADSATIHPSLSLDQATLAAAMAAQGLNLWSIYVRVLAAPQPRDAWMLVRRVGRILPCRPTGARRLAWLPSCAMHPAACHPNHHASPRHPWLPQPALSQLLNVLVLAVAVCCPTLYWQHRTAMLPLMRVLPFLPSSTRRTGVRREGLQRRCGVACRGLPGVPHCEKLPLAVLRAEPGCAPASLEPPARWAPRWWWNGPPLQEC